MRSPPQGCAALVEAATSNNFDFPAESSIPLMQRRTGLWSGVGQTDGGGTGGLLALQNDGFG
jgi:hypothetical protein